MNAQEAEKDYDQDLIHVLHVKTYKMPAQTTEFENANMLEQVASATSTFAMVFSSSMSVVQYYLLNRFPVPYGKWQ